MKTTFRPICLELHQVQKYRTNSTAKNVLQNTVAIMRLSWCLLEVMVECVNVYEWGVDANAGAKAIKESAVGSSVQSTQGPTTVC